MPDLTWNNALVLWDDYNQNCVSGHTTSAWRIAKAPQYSSIGENLAYNSISNATAIVGQWITNERTKFTYAPMTSSLVSSFGHYSQVIWADTTEIGCSLIDCRNVAGSSFSYVMACNYATAGNFLGQYPYALKAGVTDNTEHAPDGGDGDGDGDSDDGLSDGAVAGIVIGVILGCFCIVAIVAAIVVLVLFRKRVHDKFSSMAGV
eukprot:TRINITY_DN1069_c0_g1_i2.p1 TRINITY_DN1069_c0_g1~~TRINITY_DN1069_c0_g1_i2.p1  ORF type:complete len:205 (-),score=34.16 TRINITY_DN1069_c0_g1_i2:39-653(-)